jgi:hypothetical protein
LCNFAPVFQFSPRNFGNKEAVRLAGRQLLANNTRKCNSFFIKRQLFAVKIGKNRTEFIERFKQREQRQNVILSDKAKYTV